LIRAVLDANVLISGLISKKGAPGQILDAWLKGRFRNCISPAILNETSRVLKYPRIAESLESDEAEQLLYLLSALADWVDVKMELGVLTRDPSDDMYLSCAVEAAADYLVTGNASHFEQAGAIYEGVRIVSPRAFLEIIQERSP
jgi:putative PIN family toxin of toxin-antitoxin system